MHLLPPRKELRQRLVSMPVHGAGAIPGFAANKSAPRFVLDLGLAVLLAAALGRCVEVIGYFLPIAHASVTMTFMMRNLGCLRR